MKKKECPSCAMMINKTESVCPICSYEFPSESKALKWTALLLIAVFILYFLARL
jgi:RNA polymerase subunit RPABC4/transcription elongation factor Spt4